MIIEQSVSSGGFPSEKVFPGAVCKPARESAESNYPRQRTLEGFTPHWVKPPNGVLDAQVYMSNQVTYPNRIPKCSSKTTPVSVSGGKMPKTSAKN